MDNSKVGMDNIKVGITRLHDIYREQCAYPTSQFDSSNNDLR